MVGDEAPLVLPDAPSVLAFELGDLIGRPARHDVRDEIQGGPAVKAEVVVQAEHGSILGVRPARVGREQAHRVVALLAGHLQAAVEDADAARIEQVPVRQVARPFGEERAAVGQQLLGIREVDAGDVLLDGLEVRLDRRHAGQGRGQGVLDVQAHAPRVPRPARKQGVRQKNRARREERRVDARELMDIERLVVVAVRGQVGPVLDRRLARQLPGQVQAEGRSPFRIAQQGERDGHLRRPSVPGAAGGRLPVAGPGDVVGRAALDVLPLRPARRDAEGRIPVVAVLAVNVHGDVVILADSAVALNLAGVDTLGVQVQAVKGQVQVGRIRADPGFRLVSRLDRGRTPQAVKTAGPRGRLPAGVVQTAVHLGRRGRKRDRGRQPCPGDRRRRAGDRGRQHAVPGVIGDGRLDDGRRRRDHLRPGLAHMGRRAADRERRPRRGGDDLRRGSQGEQNQQETGKSDGSAAHRFIG